MKTYGYLPLVFAAAVVVCVGCRRPPSYPSKPAIDPGNHPVYITCEGNFGWANGGITVYNPQTRLSTEDLFLQANGHKAGDVVQSMTAFNNKLYVVINNSGKVLVLDPATFKITASIGGLLSPRCLLGINAAKAYVSDLYANRLAVINLHNNTVSHYINLTGWTESMCLWQGDAWVCNEKTEYLYRINPVSDRVSDSIKVGYGGHSLVVDKQNHLWVACVGDTLLGKTGNLARILPGGKCELFNLGKYSHPHHLCTNPGGDTLYFLNKDLFKAAINTSPAGLNPWFAAGKRILYSLGINPQSGEVYAADVLDYVSKGRVLRISPQSVVLDSFRTGIIPGNFCFR